MRHISSYIPRAATVLFTLGLSLSITVAGCTAADSTPTKSVEASTVTSRAAGPVRTDIQEYTLVDQILLPMVELPPLPEATKGSLTDLLLPETDLPALPAVENANWSSSLFEYLPKTVEVEAVEPAAHSYNIFTGPNYSNKVVLTYDDCPGSLEQLVSTIKVAKANDIGLVLAPTGNCVEQFKRQGHDIVELMRQHGQYVINHSVSHSALSTLSQSAIMTELSHPGVVTNYGRPPYGDGFFPSAYSQTVADSYGAVNMRPWLWTVDTEDWKGKSAAEVVAHAVNYSSQQDTVLMHMNHQAFNAESVLAIKHGLKARGLEVCSAYNGTAPELLPDSLPC